MKIAIIPSLLIAGAFVTAISTEAAAHEHGQHAGHAATPAAHAAHAADAGKAAVAQAELKSSDGSVKGHAWLAEKTGGWELKLDVSGLPAGVHGAHLHTVGKCDAPDFTTAGAHLNPAGKQHGKDNPQGAHLGDLPNVTVGADGKGTITVPLAGTAAALTSALFDADGTAVVVHATADDYKTDPSGASGGRIACGVLTRG